MSAKKARGFTVSGILVVSMIAVFLTAGVVLSLAPVSQAEQVRNEAALHQLQGGDLVKLDDTVIAEVIQPASRGQIYLRAFNVDAEAPTEDWYALADLKRHHLEPVRRNDPNWPATRAEFLKP